MNPIDLKREDLPRHPTAEGLRQPVVRNVKNSLRGGGRFVMFNFPVLQTQISCKDTYIYICIHADRPRYLHMHTCGVRREMSLRIGLFFDELT